PGRMATWPTPAGVVMGEPPWPSCGRSSSARRLSARPSRRLLVPVDLVPGLQVSHLTRRIGRWRKLAIVVQAGRIPAQDLGPGGRREGPEILGGEAARPRPDAGAVRGVVGPHESGGALFRKQLAADRVVDERAGDPPGAVV